jgi:hypothetical protein
MLHGLTIHHVFESVQMTIFTLSWKVLISVVSSFGRLHWEVLLLFPLHCIIFHVYYHNLKIQTITVTLNTF